MLLGAAASYQQPEIIVEVEAVNVLVTVTDRDGRFVTDLPRERFEVYEDSVKQTITNFARETDLPLKIGLLIDTSSSVRSKLDFEKQAAASFIRSVMRTEDEALLVEFDQGVSLLHDFTNRPSAIIGEIKKLRAGGGTALLDAIYAVANQKMIDLEARKTLVVVSDGRDLNSMRRLEETLGMSQRRGVSIYTLGTTRFGASIDHKGEKMLETLADGTGGKAFSPYSAETLNQAFEQIEAELRSRYSLTYVPENKVRDGKFRRIKIEIREGKKLKLRHRKGYFAPLQAPGSAPP
jgi:VWFA-related protein